MENRTISNQLHFLRDKFKNVIFIYISDDMEWGKENLGVRNKQGDLYFAGEGDAMQKSRYAHLFLYPLTTW